MNRTVFARANWFVAGAVAAGHLATARIYSYHRDEVYYLAAGRRLAWGYVDQPPLTPLLYRISDTLFGSSLIGLRVIPALLHASIVVLTALIARELGGSRKAQVVAAVAAAWCPLMLTTGHFLGTVTPEIVVWAGTSLFVIRILNGGDPRHWLAVGAIAGVGLLDKWTVGYLLIGLLVGLLATRERRALASPWVLAGAVLALALWSPNLVWQAGHGWPQLAVGRGLRDPVQSLLTLPYQIIIIGAAFAVLAVPGLRWMMTSPAGTRYRSFAIAFGVIVVAVMATQGKPYYASILAPTLFAAGAVAWGDNVNGALPWLLTFGVLSAPLAMPLLPLRTAEFARGVNPEIGEMIGWPELSNTVARVHRDHPDAPILASNYSEAGAIELFGKPLGLPQPISGHMNYWYWGHPRGRSPATIVVGSSDTYLARWFGSVAPAATFTTPHGVHNMERGTKIWICRDQRFDWETLWPDMRRR